MDWSLIQHGGQGQVYQWLNFSVFLLKNTAQVSCDWSDSLALNLTTSRALTETLTLFSVSSVHLFICLLSHLSGSGGNNSKVLFPLSILKLLLECQQVLSGLLEIAVLSGLLSSSPWIVPGIVAPKASTQESSLSEAQTIPCDCFQYQRAVARLRLVKKPFFYCLYHWCYSVTTHNSWPYM